MPVFTKQIVALLLALVVCLTAACGSRVVTDGAALRVGVGEGISGMLMNDVTDAAGGNGLDIDLQVFVDCCGSAAQWAMNGGELDVGFYCSSISQTLVSHNSDLEIYGPAVMNSEVIALADGIDSPTTLAVPLKRSFLTDLIHGTFPSVTEILQASPVTLYNALSRSQADGAVMDIAQAIHASDLVYAPLSGEDYVSYCLVVRKEIVNTPQFESFIEQYNLTAEEYNDHGYMENRFGMTNTFWSMINLKFLHLQ